MGHHGWSSGARKPAVAVVLLTYVVPVAAPTIPTDGILTEADEVAEVSKPPVAATYCPRAKRRAHVDKRQHGRSSDRCASPSAHGCVRPRTTPTFLGRFADTRAAHYYARHRWAHGPETALRGA